MPLPVYLAAHPQARLSASDKAELIAGLEATFGAGGHVKGVYPGDEGGIVAGLQPDQNVAGEKAAVGVTTGGATRIEHQLTLTNWKLSTAILSAFAWISRSVWRYST